MRTLTTIQSETNVLGDLTWRLTLSDQSTTFVFGRGEIVNMSDISYEIPFGGGFGKPSNYRITLQSSVEWIKTYRRTAINGEAALNVTVNSDEFTPMIGRIRNLTRYPDNPSLIEFQIYDKILDTNPMIPRDTIVDSYLVVHPGAIDMGYPLYYGKHTRPFYMTPVNSELSITLGPRNVSSANHVTSFYYYNGTYNDKEEVIKLFSLNDWEQQSDSTNKWNNFLITGNTINDNGFYSFQNQIVRDSTSAIDSDSYIKSVNGGYFLGVPYRYAGSPNIYSLKIPVSTNLTEKILFTQYVDYIIEHDNINVSSGRSSVRFAVTSENYTQFNNSITSSEASASWTAQRNLFNLSVSVGRNFFVKGFSNYIEVYATGSDSGIAEISASFQFYSYLKSSAYRKYSIYGIQQNCSEIAISENPYGIVRDLITNHSSLSLVSAQCSAAQAAANDYHFQCFMGERRPIVDIMDEIGRTTGTYLWIGDSGSINFRTYQQSASTIHDAVITTSDCLRNTFTIKDNPLGTTVYDVRKASKVKIDYDYNHQTARYELSMTAGRSNNAFCESAYHAGVQEELTLRTEYIKETATASLYIANIIRNVTQDEQIVEMQLPARYYSLELADVVKVQHPIIEGSESLYQITRIQPNYMNGTVKIAAAQIKNI